MPQKRLKDKVAIIIGDNSSLGKKIKNQFETEGAKVNFVPFDGINDSSLNNAVEIAKKNGKLDFMVHVVSGTGNIQGSKEIDQFKSVFNLDVLYSAFLGIKHTAGAMAAKGMIVFASSPSPGESIAAYQMWWNHALADFAKRCGGKAIKVENISADKDKIEAEVMKKVVTLYTDKHKIHKWGFDDKNQVAEGSSQKSNIGKKNQISKGGRS